LAHEERRLIGRADVEVSDRTPAEARTGQVGVLAAPARVELPPAIDVERLSFLEVRDRKSRQVVSVIELLSPSNKAIGSDRDQYVNKRTQLLSSPVHLVEIDLLRGGPRMPFFGLPTCD
jgi:hypothetical protein